MLSSTKSELASDDADWDRFRLRLLLRNAVAAAKISAQCLSVRSLADLRNRGAGINLHNCLRGGASPFRLLHCAISVVVK